MTIAVEPSRLEEAAPLFTQKSGHAGSLVSDMQSTTNQVVSALDAASTGGLGNVGNTVHELGSRVGISLNCFSDALQQTGQGLINAGQAYAHGDTQLASMFSQLEQAFQTTVAPPPAKHQRSFWGRVGHDLGNWGSDIGGFLLHSVVGLRPDIKKPGDLLKNPLDRPPLDPLTGDPIQTPNKPGPVPVEPPPVEAPPVLVP